MHFTFLVGTRAKCLKGEVAWDMSSVDDKIVYYKEEGKPMTPWKVGMQYKKYKNEEKLKPSVADGCHDSSRINTDLEGLKLQWSTGITRVTGKRQVKKETKLCLFIKCIVSGTVIKTALKGSGNNDRDRHTASKWQRYVTPCPLWSLVILIHPAAVLKDHSLPHGREMS